MGVINRTRVTNYRADTPFVYSTEINVKSNSVSENEKKELLRTLPNYFDDSIRAERVQRFGAFYRISNPPVFDTSHIAHSITYMNGYLNSNGYYRPVFKDSFYIKKFKDQRRTFIVFTLNPGKVTVIDSLQYKLGDSILQRLTTRPSTAKASLIKPGKSPFSKPLLGSELDRLVSVYKQHGYMLISRDNLIAEADTIDPALLKISADPFEQIKTLELAHERERQNPVAKITIQTRDIGKDTLGIVDSAQTKQYRIGKIYFYPETNYTQLPDSLMNEKNMPVLYKQDEFTVFGRRHQFSFSPLKQHTFLRKGNLYNESLSSKTTSNLSSIGAWQNVDSRYRIRVANSWQPDTLDKKAFMVPVDTVDFYYFLIPSVKQNITVSLEASRNTGDFLSTGNLFGVAINATYLNRNVWHKAIQSSTSFRNGVELSLDKKLPLLQTFQSSLSHSYIFPNILMPRSLSKIFFPHPEKLDAVKTVLSASATYSERTEYFRVRQLVVNWGYQWKRKNNIWSVKFPNVELYSLDTLPLLVKQLGENPFLRTAFTTGSIISTIGSFNTSFISKHHPKQNNFFHAAVEEAGGLAGFIHPWNENIYRYIKGEVEYRKLFVFPTTSLVGRIFAGVGYNYGKVGSSLPFYKQFFAGGPNSMRAWSLRQLGLGSSLLSDTAGTKTLAYRDRYGDMQLEANVEYRYTIAQFSSLKLGGALFTDIGNIWNIKANADNPKANFEFKNLGRDIAIGVGTGLRFDFSYFLIRIDAGIKLKDPARVANDGWLSLNNFTWRNYEYERKNGGTVVSPNRNNFAIQLGIGLPF
ncbi:MAG: outer membrane protein assembly factor [Bacteroidota bacterium]|nr:outer membrane protein assembly factor [Bacteroidota bacterium]